MSLRKKTLSDTRTKVGWSTETTVLSRDTPLEDVPWFNHCEGDTCPVKPHPSFYTHTHTPSLSLPPSLFALYPHLASLALTPLIH